MATKDEVLRIFLDWKKMVENQTGRNIKCLRSDNGGEYKSDPFLSICIKEGIMRHFTVSGTPQQNGVAERINRTLLDKVRCMLSNSGLSKKFWAEAVTYACHLINRLPSTAIEGKTPIEKWTGKPATDYEYLHIFGCPAFFHVRESKLDPRAKQAVFMGFTKGVKGYKLWCPNTKKMIHSRDVVFDEKRMLEGGKQKQQSIEEVSNYLQQVELEKDDDAVSEEELQAPAEIRTPNTSRTPNATRIPSTTRTPIEIEKVEEEVQTQEPQPQQESIAISRPRREIVKPRWLEDMVAYALPIVDDDVPSTFKEASNHSENGEWRIVMEEEM